MSNRAVDRHAFEILVVHHHRRVLAFALSLNDRREVAEDLVQDAFVTAYRELARFDPTRDFGAWVRGIVRMKYLEWGRRRRETTLDAPMIEVLESRHAAWDRGVEEGKPEALEALRHCLTRLTDLMRRTVDLFYRERISCFEIAERTDSTEDGVRKRLQRSREDLAECIESRIRGLA